MNKTSNIGAARVIVMFFFISIGIGTLLLMFPVSSNGSHNINFIDALFTATSAVSSTGLTVVDTGEAFTQFGQIVIMILVQIGGLGFMVLGVLVTLLLGKKIGMKQRAFLQESTQSVSTRGLIRLSIYILAIALVFEIIATAILTFRFSHDMPLSNALYNGMFHAVTSFNNAGFTLFNNGLSTYSDDIIVTTTIMLMIIFGGLGFIVIVDIIFKRSWRSYTLHTKLVLTASGALIVIGTLSIFIIELFNTKNGTTSLFNQFYHALFQSVTARSAGYNTVDVGTMLSSTQLIIIILMFIGAASSSTGGGIKVNTFVIILLATLTTFRGGGQIKAFNRAIPLEAVMRALAVVVSSIVAVIVLTLTLSITEDMLNEHFLEVFFESVSAVSTAGLTMGLTPDLSNSGKIIVSITMLVGRLGPLTLAYALAQKSNNSKINYPEEKVMIG
ncbi:TrkH family potassium uptake protein [Aliicoccus persicus]|uniref:Trk system potassium uptake protein TrkH n=1 Tax=Aliicoccus persicus TaxID=930138 RepID=A0A662Z4J2_9STAP|nr:TrkH family potassium uptake protein [Aliicoccus persicus]SEV84468.1 trk system potassium uptake protein TrkH [Aliicoccus persicus]